MVSFIAKSVKDFESYWQLMILTVFLLLTLSFFMANMETGERQFTTLTGSQQQQKLTLGGACEQNIICAPRCGHCALSFIFTYTTTFSVLNVEGAVGVSPDSMVSLLSCREDKFHADSGLSAIYGLHHGPCRWYD